MPAPHLFGSGTGLLVECPSTGSLPIYTLPHQYRTLQRRVETLHPSGTDAAKFHENATLVSLCAPRPEQRKLAARALRALKQPRHPGVVRAVEAERGRAAVVDGAGMVIDSGRALT